MGVAANEFIYRMVAAAAVGKVPGMKLTFPRGKDRAQRSFRRSAARLVQGGGRNAPSDRVHATVHQANDAVRPTPGGDRDIRLSRMHEHVSSGSQCSSSESFL